MSFKSFSRVALLFIAANVAMQLARAQSDSNTLDEIEVVAGTPVETGLVEHREFTGSHKRVDRQELERRDVTIADILSNEAGVQSRQSGGFGTFSSITVRAASSAQTGIYLDGILLNSGGDAVVDLSMLDLLNIDSVDIYRGATPQQFGRGTIGGAINLSSVRSDNPEPQNNVLLGIGSFDTARLQFSHRSRHGAWDVVSAFSHQQSDNDFRFSDDNRTPLNPDDDTIMRRNNSQARRISALARGGFQWNQNSRTDLLAQITSRELGVPEVRNAATNQALLETDAVRLQLSHSIDNLGLWNSKHTLFLHNDNELFDDRDGDIGLGMQYTDSAGSTLGFRTYWEHAGDTRTSGVSFEARREAKDVSDPLFEAFNFSAERLSINSSVFTTLYFKDDRLLVTPTLQVSFSDDEYDQVNRQDQSTRSDQVLSPQLGVRFDLDDDLTLRANIGRFYREPSFGELFGSRGLLVGNSGLLPEEGLNADFGLNWTPSDNITIDASLFASLRDELIARVFDSRRVGRTLNVGDARIVGIELGSDWRFGDRWSARVNATLQDARSIDVFGAFENKQLPGEAQHTTYLRLQYKDKAWRAFMEASGSWNRFYDQSNSRPARDQWLQNIGVDWQHSNLTISASLNNLSDRNVEDFSGFPRPGRSFSLSFTARL